MNFERIEGSGIWREISRGWEHNIKARGRFVSAESLSLDCSSSFQYNKLLFIVKFFFKFLSTINRMLLKNYEIFLYLFNRLYDFVKGHTNFFHSKKISVSLILLYKTLNGRYLDRWKIWESAIKLVKFEDNLTFKKTRKN